MDTDWKSFIASEIVSRTLCLAQTECGGCKDNNYCPLLHACQTTSLLRKFECLFFVKSQLREACEDYDAMQTTPPQRSKQKEMTAKPMLDATNAMAYQPPKKKQKKALKN